MIWDQSQVIISEGILVSWVLTVDQEAFIISDSSNTGNHPCQENHGCCFLKDLMWRDHYFFIHFFTYLVNKYLLISYYVPPTAWHWDRGVNKIDTDHTLMVLLFQSTLNSNLWKSDCKTGDLLLVNYIQTGLSENKNLWSCLSKRHGQVLRRWCKRAMVGISPGSPVVGDISRQGQWH